MPELFPADLIPPSGLREVLTGWTGKGLLATVAGMTGGDLVDRDWSPSDVLARANRVLLSALAQPGEDGFAGPLMRLPPWVDHWLEAMPTTAFAHRRTDTEPFRGVDWVATMVRHGWPPDAYTGRVVNRASDEFILAPAAWILGRVRRLADASTALPDDLQAALAPRIAAIGEVLDQEAMKRLVDRERPSKPELVPLDHEGAPWSTVADIGRRLMAVEDDPFEMARSVIWPDEDLAWRLFHLGCLGEVLCAARKRGFEAISLRPMGADASGPAYRLTKGGAAFDLWFEAAGAWRTYKTVSPYTEAAMSGGSPLGADIMIRDAAGRRVFVIECKYYPGNPDRMRRNGYLQALAYATEAHRYATGAVTALAVGPARYLPRLGQTTTLAGQVFIGGHDHLGPMAADWLDGSDFSPPPPAA